MVRLIPFILIVVFILAGCEGTNSEQSTEEKELYFLEKNRVETNLGSVYYRLYFEDIEQKEYRYVEVNNWEFDNFNEEAGEKIIFNSIPETKRRVENWPKIIKKITKQINQ